MSHGFAAYVDGELAVSTGDVDLAVIFSGTKGLVAICVLKLIEEGRLELDAPVTRYWPEFRHGDVLVRHVVSHTAGLPGLRPPATAEEILDSEQMETRLAEEPPLWPPGELLAYHALTYGWLCGGLIRRVDGRTVGTYFAEEIARPLDLEIWIGLPPGLEPRVARLTSTPDYAVSFAGHDRALLEAQYGAMLDSFPWNLPAVHRTGIPGAGAIASARSVAKLYGCLDRVLQPETIELGRTELARGPCAITRFPYAFGVGFELQTELMTLGPPANAFGHTGSGGGTHGCWPDERVGFSYLPTELRHATQDDRGRRRLAELYESLSRS